MRCSLRWKSRPLRPDPARSCNELSTDARDWYVERALSRSGFGGFA